MERTFPEIPPQKLPRRQGSNEGSTLQRLVSLWLFVLQT